MSWSKIPEKAKRATGEHEEMAKAEHLKGTLLCSSNFSIEISKINYSADEDLRIMLAKSFENMFIDSSQTKFRIRRQQVAN